MIGAFVFLLVSVIPAIFIAERIAKRRRRARWMRGRSAISNDEFYASLGPVPISRDAAIRVRSEVGHSTRTASGPDCRARQHSRTGGGQ